MRVEEGVKDTVARSRIKQLVDRGSFMEVGEHGADSGGGIFLYGACTDHTAADNETLHDRGGKKDQNGSAQADIEKGENIISDNRHDRGLQYSPFNDTSRGHDFDGATVVISGSGNVAIYACEKATEYGAKVVAMSDSNGYIYDKNGIDLDCIKQLKEVERKRISEYMNEHPEAEYHEGCRDIWQIPCSIALPCATQNELDKNSALALIKNGCFAVAEGANMPCTPEAVDALHANNILFAPAKAANAGGVATSALEMSQNSMRYSWSFEDVDDKLKTIMTDLYHNTTEAAAEYGMAGNLVAGANIAGFLKVADSMMSYGVV